MQVRRGVLVTLVATSRPTISCCASLTCHSQIARDTLRLNDETVRLLSGNRLEGGVSNRLELDQAIANRAQTAASIPEYREPDRDH
jgi:hypothetical protein